MPSGLKSFRLSPFAANKRVRMLLQVVSQNAYGSRSAPELLQSLVDLLDLLRSGPHQAVSIGQRHAGVAKSRVHGVERGASTHKCWIKLCQRLLQVDADLLQRQLVELGNNVAEAFLHRLELSRRGW